MPLTRSTLRVTPFALLAAALVVPTHGLTGAAPAAQPAAAKSAPAPEVEVRCADDSTIKVKLLDDKLEVSTKYGQLQIQAGDVRRIEFATRTPPEVAERVSLLISNLSHPDFDARERATAELRELRERAYLPLLKAIKHPDAEISRRAEETVRYLQAKVPAGQLEPREQDVIHTDDSRITGRLVTPALRVQTMMFGEQSLRLADVRSLRSLSGGSVEDVAHAPAAPANMMQYQGQFGKEVVVSVTGVQPNGQGMGVWGSDVYTLDSNLAAAAVHAGAVQPGSTGAVRVRVVASPAQFGGSSRNGVTSASYGNFPSGAYEFVRK